MPMKTDVKSVRFSAGSSPIYLNFIEIKAEWCGNPTCKTDKFTVFDRNDSRQELNFSI